jgi:hypothetical protein
MLGSFLVAAQLVASQEGLSSMKLVMLVLLMGGIHELRRSGFINIGSVARGQPHVQTVR